MTSTPTRNQSLVSTIPYLSQLIPSPPALLRSKHLTYVLSLLVITIDNFNTAGSLTLIPSLSESFSTSTTLTSWCFSAYALTLGSFIIISGKLCDVVGTREMFVCGVLGMGIAVFICGFIENLIIVLIVFRAIQGMFGSVLIPGSFTITSSFYGEESKELELACKVMTLGLEVSLGLGLVIAGAFTELKSVPGFRAFYWYSAGISLFAGFGLLWQMQPIKRTSEHEKLSLKHLDYGGCLLLIVGLVLVIYGLTKGGEDWKQKSAYVPLIVGTIVCVAVVGFEMGYIQWYKDRYAKQRDEVEQHMVDISNSGEGKGQTEVEEIELINEVSSADWRITLDLLFPRSLLHIPNFHIYMLGSFLMFLSFTSLLALTLQYHVYVLSESAFSASLKTLSLTGGLLGITLVYREDVMHKLGIKTSLISSALISLGGAIWISRLDFTTSSQSYWIYEFPSLFLCGIGINLYFLIYMNAILANTPLHLQGLVAGVLQTAGQVGVSIGNAVIASILGELEIKEKNYLEMWKLQGKVRCGFYVPVASFAVMIVIFCFIKNDGRGGDDNDNVEDEEQINS